MSEQLAVAVPSQCQSSIPACAVSIAEGLSRCGIHCTTHCRQNHLCSHSHELVSLSCIQTVYQDCKILSCLVHFFKDTAPLKDFKFARQQTAQTSRPSEGTKSSLCYSTQRPPWETCWYVGLQNSCKRTQSIEDACLWTLSHLTLQVLESGSSLRE